MYLFGKESISSLDFIIFPGQSSWKNDPIDSFDMSSTFDPVTYLFLWGVLSIIYLCRSADLGHIC